MSEEQLKIIDKERLRLKEHVSHEETLINNRMTWMLTIQGFLFAAFALIFESRPDIKAVELESCDQMMCVYLDVIPVLGATIAFLVFLGVFAAYVSIDNLKHETNKNIHKANEIIHGEEKHREMQKKKHSALASILGRIVSMSVPSAIVLTWFYLTWMSKWADILIVKLLFWLLFALIVSVIAFKANAATKTEPMKL